MASYLEGASYPVGGASRIAAALARQFAQRGLIVTSAEVAGIMLDGMGAQRAFEWPMDANSVPGWW